MNSQEKRIGRKIANWFHERSKAKKILVRLTCPSYGDIISRKEGRFYRAKHDLDQCAKCTVKEECLEKTHKKYGIGTIAM